MPDSSVLRKKFLISGLLLWLIAGTYVLLTGTFIGDTQGTPYNVIGYALLGRSGIVSVLLTALSAFASTGAFLMVLCGPAWQMLGSSGGAQKRFSAVSAFFLPLLCATLLSQLFVLPYYLRGGEEAGVAFLLSIGFFSRLLFWGVVSCVVTVLCARFLGGGFVRPILMRTPLVLAVAFVLMTTVLLIDISSCGSVIVFSHRFNLECVAVKAFEEQKPELCDAATGGPWYCYSYLAELHNDEALCDTYPMINEAVRASCHQGVREHQGVYAP